MGLCPPSVVMAAPQTIFKRAHSRNSLNIYWWGKRGAAAVIDYFPADEPPILWFKEVPNHSPQYKELYAVYLTLKEVKDPLNLFSDSVYAVNLLPWLSRSFIKLDVKTLPPIFIQVSTLVQERDSTIYIQNVRSHSPLSGPISDGSASLTKPPQWGHLPLPLNKQINFIYAHTQI